MDFNCSKWRPQVKVLGLLINRKSKTKTEILKEKSDREAWLCIGPHHASQGSQQKEINLGGVGGGEIVDTRSITKKGRGFGN